MTYRWFVGLSKWSLLTKAQISELVKEGCEGFSIHAGQGEKIEDPLASSHITLAKKSGVPYIVQHWIDPTKDPIKQAKYSVALAKKFEAQGIVPDIKQWWMNWEEWHTVNVLGLPGSVRAYNSDQLLRFYGTYLRELNALNRKETKLPIMVCSTQRFLHGHCRALATVIRDSSNDFWNASYVAWQQTDTEPDISWTEFHSVLDRLGLSSSRMPNGISKWGAWRFAIFPKRGYGKLDVSVITDEASVRYFTPPILQSAKEEDHGDENK